MLVKALESITMTDYYNLYSRGKLSTKFRSCFSTYSSFIQELPYITKLISNNSVEYLLKVRSNMTDITLDNILNYNETLSPAELKMLINVLVDYIKEISLLESKRHRSIREERTLTVSARITETVVNLAVALTR
jgi:hypothetical protein